MARAVSLVVCGLLLLVGCAKDAAPPQQTPTASADAEKYLLDESPAEAAEVIAARKSAVDDEQVAVVGRIGGSVNPWIEGKAAFSIVDRSLLSCSDRPGDNCPKPWDYCCETDKLPTATALVKLVDASGQLVATDARQLLGVKELQTVVARGRARRDESGNLTILATGIHLVK